MAECKVCGKRSEKIASILGVCGDCVRERFDESKELSAEAHRGSRERFGLPGSVPDEPGGKVCKLCSNQCRLLPDQLGYCGIRRFGPKVRSDRALVSWYLDSLPTNCVADWVCPAGTGSGYPEFACQQGPEFGHTNLAVFFEACSFDCLFCQNYTFRRSVGKNPDRTIGDLASSIQLNTSCICYFGGDPSPQMVYSLKASILARQQRKDKILRICWETNGSMAAPLLKEALEIAAESGGCVKFDLKCVTRELSLALCGVPNDQTLSNFRLAAEMSHLRPKPPLVVASTLLVPGYVEHKEVARIARFIASCNPSIPYSLLAFQPTFEMADLPLVSRNEAMLCEQTAKDAGLTRIRTGNQHLLVS